MVEKKTRGKMRRKGEEEEEGRRSGAGGRSYIF